MLAKDIRINSSTYITVVTTWCKITGWVGAEVGGATHLVQMVDVTVWYTVDTVWVA
jgi:hypothetical protein